MIERPKTHNPENADRTASLYLADLGLTWGELKGKKVLDVGVLDAQFENAARRQGIDVVSIDQGVGEEYVPPQDSQFAVAKATKLPFRDESFDYVLSHMSVTNYMEDGYADEDHLLYLEDAFKEICRVLRSGRRYHFTDTTLDDHMLQKDPNDTVPKNDSDEYLEWRMAREQAVLEKLMKRIGFSRVELHKYTEEQKARQEEDEFSLTHYYIATR